VYAGAKLLEALGDGEGTIEERLADAPHYWSTSEGRTDVGEEMKFGLINNLKARFEKDYEVIALDGMRVVFPTGWALVRASNTEPAITYRVESTKSAEDLDRLRGIIRDALKDEGVDIKI
jgi:phosphomannomutase/phosphoglucomutase